MFMISLQQQIPTRISMNVVDLIVMHILCHDRAEEWNLINLITIACLLFRKNTDSTLDPSAGRVCVIICLLIDAEFPCSLERVFVCETNATPIDVAQGRFCVTITAITINSLSLLLLYLTMVSSHLG